jgi:transcriptional regulator with XRE-family HTH domain
MQQKKEKPFESTEDQAKEKIYAFCEINGLSYSQLGKLTGVNKNTIYPFMNGKSSVSTATLEKIERYIYEFNKE